MGFSDFDDARSDEVGDVRSGSRFDRGVEPAEDGADGLSAGAGCAPARLMTSSRLRIVGVGPVGAGGFVAIVEASLTSEVSMLQRLSISCSLRVRSAGRSPLCSAARSLTL